MDPVRASAQNSYLAATAEPSREMPEVHGASQSARGEGPGQIDAELANRLDRHSLESIVELKISRFLDQIGTFYPEDLHALIMKKVEKPLLGQILRRTGGNQVHASKILGINRNTLRKKMKLYGFNV